MGIKVVISTACYLEKDNKILFLKFNKKWKQIFCVPGGKMEEGESPLECTIREFKEETGLTLIKPQFKGYSYWSYIDKEYGIIFFYYAHDYTGELRESSEGKLFWIDKSEINNLQQFPMNAIFSDLMFEKGTFEGNFNFNEDESVKEYKIKKFN